MKPLKFVPLLALAVVLSCLTQCRSGAGETETDSENVDSVIVNEKMEDAGKFRTSLKFYEMSMAKETIDSLLALPNFASLFFTVSHNNAKLPRYTRLIAYALDSAGNFIMNGSDILLVNISVKAGSKPIVVEKETSLEIGNMYLGAHYLRKLDTRSSGYKVLHFTPQVSSPLSYALRTDRMTLTDCTLQPSPPAKPGTSSCQ